jgi:hypothetical protein
MSKNFITSIFSTLLIFSMMAPIMVSYMNLNLEAIVYGEFSEKEKKDKSEIDVVEKDLIDLKSHYSECIVLDKKASLNSFYWKLNQAYSSKIFLPPPEYFI